MKKLSILGSTGSIGTQTLEVVRNNPKDFCVCGLSCHSNVELLFEQIKEFKPSVVGIDDETKAKELEQLLANSQEFCGKVTVVSGDKANSIIATLDEVDMVVASIVGVAGMMPVIDAINAKKDIALANKETLVAGGEIVMPLVKEKGVMLLPVDSEHSAIWQCLWGEKQANLDRILLTASGGPFRGYTRKQLENVDLKSTLKHPTWKMGGKITVDSATMMNKGLEVIEASHLFDVSVDRVDVVVHPQSVVHSMIRLKDGSVLAQMGKPSMILPIMIALYYPERGEGFLEKFDPFCQACNSLSFEKCDTEVFGLLKLAYDAGRTKGVIPAAMSAANEVAVDAFLREKVSFLDIERIVYNTLDKMSGTRSISSMTADTIIEADKQARIYAGEIVKVII